MRCNEGVWTWEVIKGKNKTIFNKCHHRIYLFMKFSRFGYILKLEAFLIIHLGVNKMENFEVEDKFHLDRLNLSGKY